MSFVMPGNNNVNIVAFHFCRFSADGDKVIVSGLYADSPSEMAREVAYKIYLHPDKHQDYLLTEMLQSRYQLATICDFPTYAHRWVYFCYKHRGMFPHKPLFCVTRGGIH